MKAFRPLALAAAALLILAAVVGAQTAPRFVAEISTTGFLPCYRTTAADQELSIVEIEAVTDLTFSCWSWNQTDGWEKISPVWTATTGAAAGSDTVLTISAGDAKSYYFRTKRLKAIWVNGGTGYVAGE